MGSHDRARLVEGRFKTELGYQSAMAWPIYAHTDGGPVMYHMIHATDHPAAPDLMRRAYMAAVTEPPKEQLKLELSLVDTPDTEPATVRSRP
jgi:hypothetical protein